MCKRARLNQKNLATPGTCDPFLRFCSQTAAQEGGIHGLSYQSSFCARLAARFAKTFRSTPVFLSIVKLPLERLRLVELLTEARARATASETCLRAAS